MYMYIYIHKYVPSPEQAGEWQWALHLLVELGQLSMESTVISYSSVISSFENLVL